jgi:hypothetical protein
LKNTVYYPFHPLHGQEVEVSCRARRENDWVMVSDPQGVPLKIPAWMLLPEAARYGLSNQATIGGSAWLGLCDLLGGEFIQDTVAEIPAARRGALQRPPSDNRP